MFRCVHRPRFAYPFICPLTLGLLSSLARCESRYYTRGCANICLSPSQEDFELFFFFLKKKCRGFQTVGADPQALAAMAAFSCRAKALVP